MQVRFNLEKDGPLTLWETPDPKDSYIIGADVSEGVVDGDYSCAQVISRNKFKQVACWHGKIEPYEFGRALFGLGIYFNTGLLAVERNSAGVTTVDCLRKMDYPNLFKMVRFDQGMQDVMDRFGWITNVHSRGLMLGVLREVVRENSLILSDPDTLAEMKTFVKNRDTEKMEASAGNHDDRLMALGIAAYLHRTLSYAGAATESRLAVMFDRDVGLYETKLGRGGY